MQFSKALSLVLGSLLLSTPFAHADFSSMVDQNFSELPQEDLKTIPQSQYIPLGIDAALALIALRLAHVPSPADAKRQSKDAKLREHLVEFGDKVNAARRLNVRSEEQLRVRLAELMAASQMPTEVGTARALSEQIAGLQATQQASPEDLATLNAELSEARKVVAAKLTTMTDVSGGALDVTPESLEKLGYYPTGDSIYAEYESLRERYTDAVNEDKMPKLIAQLQAEAADGEKSSLAKYDEFDEEFKVNKGEAGAFRRYVVGGLIGKIGGAIVVYDLVGRIYLFGLANRDPGFSPALTTLKILKDAALPAKN